MHYSIDDSDGTNICGGIQLESRARRLAQEHADASGEPVRLYSSEPGDDGETIHPRAMVEETDSPAEGAADYDAGPPD